MAAAGAVVTFNGKSFDMPLLETRFVLSRLRVPAGLPHADLLHPARRLLEPRLPDVRLGSLERAILGFEREDDIEGADIPQAWFDWLHAGETADVIRAVRHNAWDLLALIGLLESLVLLATGEAASSVRADGMGLVDHRLRLGDEAGARARIASIGSEPLEGARARRRARLTRRLLGPEAARGHWQELVRRGDPFAEPHEELAKLLEHRDRDPAAALRIVEAALRHAPPRGARERLLRRLARLEALVAGPRGRLAAKGPEFTELACTDTLRAPAAWKSSRSATRTAPSRRSPSS